MLYTFSNEDMLEIEALGPLVTLQPGQKAELAETWELHGGVEDFTDEEGILRNVLPRVEGA